MADQAAENALAGPAGRQFEEVRRALVERRQALGMSMSELARQIGVSPSMVSQIERGQTLPSVATLFALAAALGATVDAFFGEAQGETAEPGPEPVTRTRAAAERLTEAFSQPAGHRYVVRRNERASIEIRGGVRWERLTPVPMPEFEFLELVYRPNAQSDTELYRHPGVDLVVVLEGRLDIHIGFDRYTLEEGDSIVFPSSLPHRYVNPTDRVSRAVTVILRDAPGGSEPLAVDMLLRALEGEAGGAAADRATKEQA